MQHLFPIMWYEGMPLDPAALQQSDLHKAQALNYLFSMIDKDNWGVSELEIDETHLTQGIFSIKKIVASFQDHSIINFQVSDQEQLSIDLKTRENDLKSQESFIFLNIPNNHLAYKSSFATPRYIPKEIDEVKDLTTNDLKTKISVLKTNYSLSISETAPIGMISIPIAKIKFTGINYELSEFSPPSLNLNASPILAKKLEAVIKSGRDKLKYLLNKNEDKAQTKLMISSLGNIIFPIEHMFKAKASPKAIFLHLVSILGSAISFFQDNPNVPVVPEYDHLNHLKSIKPLLNLINQTLESVKEPYASLKFKHQDSIFGIMLPKEINKTDAKSITIGLIRKPNAKMEDLATWINNSIITTEEKITTMQDQRIQGASRNIIRYSQNLDIKTTQDMLLVEIDLNKTYITNDKMLCILNLDLSNMPEAIYLFQKTSENEL